MDVYLKDEIIPVKTYLNENGDEYTDIERIYLSLTLSGGCCDEGGLFGPWYLYGIGIVNPESESAVAYAIGYGDGGFGQLTPGILKITGDLATGEIGVSIILVQILNTVLQEMICKFQPL